MIKLKEILTQQMPEYFYHATYKTLLPDIQKYGLNTTLGDTNWEDSIPGYVYLANDPDIAESYAEESEEVPEEWLDEIIILRISSNTLDINKIHDDDNVIMTDDEPSNTFEYHGIIPWTNIELYK